MLSEHYLCINFFTIRKRAISSIHIMCFYAVKRSLYSFENFSCKKNSKKITMRNNWRKSDGKRPKNYSGQTWHYGGEKMNFVFPEKVEIAQLPTPIQKLSSGLPNHRRVCRKRLRPEQPRRNTLYCAGRPNWRDHFGSYIYRQSHVRSLSGD